MPWIERQIPLDLAFPLDWRFDSFQDAGDNGQAVAALKRIAAGPDGAHNVLLWGPSGTGKSHLLAATAGETSTWTWAPYIDLAEAVTHEHRADFFVGLESAGLVCLDGVDLLCGDLRWEESLFHLHNRMQQRGGVLLMTASRAPSALSWCLPDWGSRVSAALVYRLYPLRDETLPDFLRDRAMQKGLELPVEVGQFILQRHTRDVPALCRLIDQLDRAALAAARKLTLPFVRSVLLDPALPPSLVRRTD